MSGERTRCRNTTLVLGVIIAILIGALAGTLYYSNMLLSSKDSYIEDLQNQNRELQNQISVLRNWLIGNKTYCEKEIADLQNQSKELNEQINILASWLAGNRSSYEEKIKSLQKQITDLQNQVTSLETLNMQLQTWLEGNKTLLRGLSENMTACVRTVKELQSQIDKLQKQVSMLTSIVNQEETATLEKDKTINLRPRSYLGFSYYTPYAGYITITFTATGAVKLWVGSSSTTPTYYFSYSPSKTYATITIPVTRGTTYIVFENPSYFSGVTITYTITYTY
ncbi:MAG: hypothetical protein QXG81_06835 [Ignisphaera sp.]